VRLAAAAFVFSSFAVLAGCERNKEVTAEEVQAALRTAGYTITPTGADPDVGSPVQSACFEMQGQTSKQTVCVWRCTQQEICGTAMRDMMGTSAPRKYTEVSTFQVDRCVIVEKDCKGTSCPRLHDDVAKTHMRW
jgi:hypothetical protein